MRVVFMAIGTRGDVRPNVVIAEALQSAGYEVLMLVGESYQERVAARNLPTALISGDIQEMVNGMTTDDMGLIKGMQLMNTVLKPRLLQIAQDIEAVMQPGDVILLNEPFAALLNGVIEKYNFKPIFLNLQASIPNSEFVVTLPAPPAWLPAKGLYYQAAGNMARRIFWTSFGSVGNRHRKEYLGLPKLSAGDYRKLLDTTPTLIPFSPHILPKPASWADHQRMTGYLFDEDTAWDAPQPLSDFLKNGEKPVYIGFGSMPDSKPQETLELILAAMQQHKKRVIWLSHDIKDSPHDDLFILEYASHHWLLPQMAAIVHHGGAGTTAAGLVAGVPSVIVPFAGDQAFWGRHIHQLGAGTKAIPRKKLTPQNLADAIIEATTNQQMKRTAAAFSEKIRAEDGVGNALAAIQSFLKKTETNT